MSGILIGIGANLAGGGYAGPLQTCLAAVRRLPEHGFHPAAVSPWYESAPVPASDQPWYVNAVIAGRSPLSPACLLAGLHRLEAAFGRVRTGRNAARTLDLDILDYDGRRSVPGAVPVLPHPRLHERAFVLLPLARLCPGWRHPVSGLGPAALLAALAPGQRIRRLDDGPHGR